MGDSNLNNTPLELIAHNRFAKVHKVSATALSDELRLRIQLLKAAAVHRSLTQGIQYFKFGTRNTRTTRSRSEQAFQLLGGVVWARVHLACTVEWTV